MGTGVGGNPGAVYTETDQVQGKCPTVGQYFEMTDGQGTKGFYLCEVTASQNLTNGMVVSFGPDFRVTVMATNSPGSGNTLNTNLGVAVVSITASASTLIWVQVVGRGNVLSSLSALPFIHLKIGSVAGQVDDDVTSSASSIIEGISLTVTSGLAATLTACLLTWPRIGPTPVSA